MKSSPTTEMFSITEQLSLATSTPTPTTSSSTTLTTPTTPTTTKTTAAVVSPPQSPTPIEIKLTDKNPTKSMSFKSDENIIEEDANFYNNKLNKDFSQSAASSSELTEDEEYSTSLQNESNYNCVEPEEDEDIEDINKSMEDIRQRVEKSVESFSNSSSSSVSS